MAGMHHTADARLLGLDTGGAPMPFAEPGVTPHYGPSWTFRVAHAHVVLHLQPAQRTYFGHTTFRITPLPTFSGTVRLDLDGVPVDRVVDDEQAALPFTLTDGALVITVGEARTFTVHYGGHTPRAGLYFTGPTPAHPTRDAMAWTQCQDEDAHFFMPCLDHPRIKHPWTVELYGPEGTTLLSNGALVEHEGKGDGVHAVFDQADPMPAYLFTAVCGPLHITEDAWRDVAVRYLVPRGEEEPVQRAMGRTPEMMEVFSDFTGVDYPWPRYDTVVVHEFVFGGMENTACTTMTDVLLVDERTLPHWDPEGLVCHELAHQWFGNLVTCQDWSQAWLNESWATFMETVWYAHRHGEAETTWYAFGQARSYLEEDSGRYRRPIASYLFREPIDVFDRHIYEKGAVVMRTLRHELGDEAFRAGMTHYLTQFAHRTVHGRDFQRCMEEATGANLDRFVHQWILGAGHPRLEVELGQADGLLTVGIQQTQTGDETAEVFHLGLRLEIVPEDGEPVVVTLPVKERQRAWAVPFEGAIRTVRVDPGFRVLAEVVLSGSLGWLGELAFDACPVLATRALRALCKRNTPDAIAIVRRALGSHPMWAVRGEAASLLGSRGGTDSRDALLAALDSEQEPRARASVARALGAFREAGVADALMVAIEANPPTWHLLGDLLEALGKTRDPRALSTITPFLHVGCPGEIVRQRAATAIAHTRDEAAVDALLAWSATGLDDRAQSGCARALGILGDQVDAARTACRERLEALLDEGGFRTQLAALGALGQVRDPASIPRLTQVHTSAPDGRVRRMAWEALVKVRAGRTTEAGLATLRDQLDSLMAANHALRARVDKLERP